MTFDEDLQRLISHRLDSLSILVLMLEFRLTWAEPKPMRIFVEDKLQFEGLTSLLLNPVVEAGILHIRALLEFLGLKSKSGMLVTVTPKERRADDAAIELLFDGANLLQAVTPEQACAEHPSEPALAEISLAAAIGAANKGMAHFSANYLQNTVEAEQLLLAARITQQLVERYVYKPLGRKRPPVPIEARARTSQLSNYIHLVAVPATNDGL